MATIIDALRNVKTMPEVDALRKEVAKAAIAGGDAETFKRIQKEFIKAKNRLRRIPLAERSW